LHVNHLELLELTTVLFHVSKTLVKEFPAILAKSRASKWLVQLDDLKVDHLTNKCHNPVLVGLKLCLVDGWDTEDFNFRSKLLNVLVHQLEVTSQAQVCQHLLKAQLMEQMAPCKLN